ncbi:apolipoprotein N-acyltransferase [Sulfitobacter sp. SK012]|uniref:apolipoprotein N-acyltransferase n=1 Tax=Sulfitobacter sp. SK012 TaxID=1389005 RepID=UPI000E0BC931|nr:apolipoprotein N-acyltransferase [Sulfitobacter sp. SK012]AXI45476.1 apolipoprotein N-acyltransferase [Sulfitobacter sp. SK012]
MIRPARRRLLAGFVLGALAALGQAPFDIPILMLVALVVAIRWGRSIRVPRRAAAYGWVFGFGYFSVALHWIVSPFLIDVARHGWMAPFALVFLAAGMALFWGAAFWGARLMSRRQWPLILCLPAAELVRAYIFTGFPWANFAQAMVDVKAGQGLALVGPYAMTLWLVATAVILSLRATGRPALLAGQVALALSSIALLVLPPRIEPAPLTDQVVRLIQPNSAQREKWDPEKLEMFYRRQIAYTAAPPTGEMPEPSLVIWPETAIPWPLDLAQNVVEEISFSAAGRSVILGVQRRTQTRFFNSLVLLGPQGEIAQTYDKHHLVPFGEYMPLGELAAKFGIHGLAAQEGNGYSAGPGAVVIEVPGIGPVLPLICYEAVFAHDVNAAPTRPNLIVQVTNDAWFGRAAGPEQHLAQARMRAIEQGVPLARSANTGISAMVDPWGRVTHSLALNTAGYVDAVLPKPRSATLYSRWGDMPLAVLLLLGLLVGGTLARRRDSD